MNKIEQEVFECFGRPRTLEDAFKRSQFHNIHNFRMYVDRLVAAGELEEELKISNKAGWVEDDRIFSQNKPKKTGLYEKIDNFIAGTSLLLTFALLFFGWHNINILELF